MIILSFVLLKQLTEAWFPYSRKVNGGSLPPSSTCHAPGTPMERLRLVFIDGGSLPQATFGVVKKLEAVKSQVACKVSIV